ncbi:hypothetical protein MMB232_01684 [Brevundimonas subvibrioides]|uniref:Uncharacterized protein n=1 Tax=Brevundimonas subvibrioides (strain ATCC 15264 / DSM 4735 / LMG 14903 / NBRC 16000 / CB 81) TaxID=633149 RepID=D9QH83_BRESC|nr:hypothetical protein [Brevundimonas subvibrioides]ADL01049.1 hypothetical protein Bresu_1738 [Brevundimonas subvibrioides ATCC 15264]
MTDPTPQPEIPPMDPVPAQPEIDPAGTPDEVPPMPGETDGDFDRPGAI